MQDVEAILRDVRENDLVGFTLKGGHKIDFSGTQAQVEEDRLSGGDGVEVCRYRGILSNGAMLVEMVRHRQERPVRIEVPLETVQDFRTYQHTDYRIATEQVAPR